MTEHSSPVSSSNSIASERRGNHRLRGVFEQAYNIAYPLLDANRAAGSNHFLRVTLRDAFPELHLQDIAILSVAIERVFIERSRAEKQ